MVKEETKTERELDQLRSQSTNKSLKFQEIEIFDKQMFRLLSVSSFRWTTFYDVHKISKNSLYVSTISAIIIQDVFDWISEASFVCSHMFSLTDRKNKILCCNQAFTFFSIFHFGVLRFLSKVHSTFFLLLSTLQWLSINNVLSRLSSSKSCL